jgi:OFA family oxalate/formate antiporter-like MFS transporter
MKAVLTTQCIKASHSKPLYAGLLVIVNATPMLYKTASHLVFFAVHAWMLASYGGIVNLTGRVGTGFYSDKIGRKNAYILNGIFAAVCLFLMPYIMKSGNVLLLFLVVSIAYWQYGGTLSLMPAIYRRLLWAEKPGLQLWHSLPWRRDQLPYAGNRRFYQGRYR